MQCQYCQSKNHESGEPSEYCINDLREQIMDQQCLMDKMSGEIAGFQDILRIHGNVKNIKKIQEKGLRIIKQLCKQLQDIHPEWPETYPEILNRIENRRKESQ